MTTINTNNFSGVNSNKKIKGFIQTLENNDTNLNNGKLEKTLSSGKIFVGNGSNEATGVDMSGEATIDNTGAITLNNNAITGKVLTGFTKGTGGETIAATDTILEAIQKITGNIDENASYVSTVSSTDNAIVKFDGDTGQVQNTGIIIDDSNNVSGINDLTLTGNLTVNGTTTTLNTTDLEIEDKNITLGKTDTPTDTTANGGGLTLKGDTDKTFNWVQTTGSFTSSENIDLATGKSYYVDGTLLKEATEELKNKTINASNNTISNISNANIDNSAAIVDTKLAQITTANKVAGSAVQLGTGSGLEDSTGLKVKVDSSTVQVNGTGEIEVKDAGITFAKIQNINSNKILGSIAGGSVEEIDCTSAGRALLDDADATAQRATLGLGNVNNTSDDTKKISFNTYYKITDSATPTKAQLVGKGVLAIVSADSKTVQLPAVSASDDGIEFRITNDSSSSHSIVVSSADSYNVDGASTSVLQAGEYLSYVYNHASTEFIGM